MSEPKIVYGTLEQPIHRNGQYLLMEAEITVGTYRTPDFIDRINAVSLDGIGTQEGRKDVGVQRNFMQLFAKGGDTVTIKDFNPDRAELEGFVNTTFREMCDQLHGRR